MEKASWRVRAPSLCAFKAASPSGSHRAFMLFVLPHLHKSLCWKDFCFILESLWMHCPLSNTLYFWKCKVLVHHCCEGGKTAEQEEKHLPQETFKNLVLWLFFFTSEQRLIVSSSCTSWLLIGLENSHVYSLVEYWEPSYHTSCSVCCQILGKSWTWGEGSLTLFSSVLSEHILCATRAAAAQDLVGTQEIKQRK